MCMYSLLGRNEDMRKAKVGEDLVRDEYKGHACFTGRDDKLACIKHGTTVQIDRIRFVRGVSQRIVQEWEGKSVTATLISVAYGRRYAADCLALKPDVLVALSLLKFGLVMRIPRKVRSDKGSKRPRPRNLVKVLGLDQIKADVPLDRTVDA
jgi:hypothetical protein